MTSRRALPLSGALPLLLLFANLLSGCGTQMDCALMGDNMKGRISFAASVPILTDKSIMVEWSQDSFATVAGRSTLKPNVQGLLAIPYSVCIDPNVDLQVRAYEDANDNAAADAGEPAGRYDLTANGDAAFVNVQVHSTTSSSTSQKDWDVKEGVDIVIDTQ